MNLRTLMVAGVVLLIAGCAPVPVRVTANAGSLAAQTDREAVLAQRRHWTLQARLFVSDGKDGGTTNLTWTQDDDRYDFIVRYPITGKTIRLHGGPEGAELEGADGGTVRGASAEALMNKTLGWQVPLDNLRAWVLGARARGSAGNLSFAADGLPGKLEQDGWTVDYRDFDRASSPPLPSKVFATKPPYVVKLANVSWSFR
jgi:outer membrane lipoprotein LolB